MLTATCDIWPKNVRGMGHNLGDHLPHMQRAGGPASYG